MPNQRDLAAGSSGTIQAMAKRLDWDLANRKRRGQGHDGPPPDDAHVRGLRAKREILQAAGFRNLRKNSADEIEDLFLSLNPDEISRARRRLHAARDSGHAGRLTPPGLSSDEPFADGFEGVTGAGGRDLIRSTERQKLLTSVRDCGAAERADAYERTSILFDAMSAKAVETIEADASLSDEGRAAKFVQLAAMDRRWKQLLRAAGRSDPSNGSADWTSGEGTG